MLWEGSHFSPPGISGPIPKAIATNWPISDGLQLVLKCKNKLNSFLVRDEFLGGKNMTITSFQEIIDSIEQLSFDEQDYLFELIKKRRIEKRRSEIAADAKATLEAFKQGKAKKGSVEDLIADLLDDDDY
jgi:hypothetical protein